MPESVEVCAGSPKKDESQSTVHWEVEDPSEFRPDILSDMGKDEAEFRVFNVSAYSVRHVQIDRANGSSVGVVARAYLRRLFLFRHLCMRDMCKLCGQLTHVE